MRQFVPTLCLILSISATALSQAARPTPPADQDVVKIETNVIQLDVTVTDKKGNPITDLRRDEIEIFENGKRQEIFGFNFVSGAKRATGEKPPDKTPNPAAYIPNPGWQRPENVRRTIALVVDDLTLSFASSYWVKSALKKFINEQMQEGDLVAIVRTASGVGVLQQFTTDKRQLLAAAEKVKFHMGPTSKIGIFNPIVPTLREASGKGESEENDNERKFEYEANQSREAIFTSGTLGALNYIVRGMGDLPGRKSVVLLSDGLALVTRDERGVPQGGRILDGLRRLTDLANRASVVVYTIDARGLDVPMLSAEDNTYGVSEEQIVKQLQDRRNAFFDTQSGLSYLSNQTGGMAILNSNDITRGLGRVLNDQSFYLVAYEPDDATFDPRTRRYNKIEVKVLREGARVRHRSGFFGVADSAIKRTAERPEQAILNALTSPFAVNDISVRLNAVFTAPERSNTYVRSFIHLDANDLTIEKKPDGTYSAALDIVAMTFGDNGTVVDEHARRYTITLKEDAYEKLMRKGFVYEFALPLKKAGGIQMRVAVRDAGSNKVGSASQFIEVPNLKNDRLALSGVVFEGIPLDVWQKIADGSESYNAVKPATDPMTDTSLRQFTPGTAMRYGVDIYNAKTDAAGKRDLSQVVKLYREGNEYYTSPEMPIQAAPSAKGGITTTGTIRIFESMPVGEYVLQVIVYDKLAREKRSVAAQFVAFEVVR